MARYKALKQGYDGVKVREPGEEFEFEGKPGKWMKQVSGKAYADGKPQDVKERERGYDRNEPVNPKPLKEADEGGDDHESTMGKVAKAVKHAVSGKSHDQSA